MTAVCVLCKRETVAAVAVRHIERASGPGVTVYACPDCAPHVETAPLPGELPPPVRG